MNMFSYPDGHVFYRRLKHQRPNISHGKGIHLFDAAGQRYIDASGGPIVVNIGHSHPAVVLALQAQIAEVSYVHGAMFTSNPVEEYSHQMAKYIPFKDPKFYYLSSGSEVVEASLKLARQIQISRGEKGRYKVVSRQKSYHGRTLGTLAMTGRDALKKDFLPMLPKMPLIDTPYHYRDHRSGLEMAALLEETIKKEGAETVSAFLAESISGASLGAAVPDDAYWPEIRRICDKYGVLLICDEVLVGVGRTGKFWGIDHWGISPDILVSSKGASGGYVPFGFMATSAENVDLIQEKYGDFNHGGTFSHHILGATAALATLKVIENENLIENAHIMGIYLKNKLFERFGEHPNIGNIRGKGLLYALELVEDKKTKTSFAAKYSLAQKIHDAAFKLGLIVYYSHGFIDGVQGELILLGPPLIVNQAQIDEIITLLAAAIGQVLREK